MRYILFITLFLCVLSQRGMTQGAANVKELQVLRDSGTVYFSAEELIPDPALRKKYLTDIEYVKRDDNGALLLKPKNSIKPKLRIEVNVGTSVVSEPEDSLLKTPTQINRFAVRSIYKKEQYLVVKFIDNYSNSLLANEEYELKPRIIHGYYPELHYTDVDGNPQVYTHKSKQWIPISPNSSATVVVKDEYGQEVNVLSICFNSPCIFGNNMVANQEGCSLLPWQIGLLSNISKRCPCSIISTIGNDKGEEYKDIPYISLIIRKE